MNDIQESMEKYNGAISEQGEYGAETLSHAPPISPHSRERVLAVAWRKAVHQLGCIPLGSTLHDRARFILDRARACNLDAKTYEIIWFIYRTSTEHMIIDNGANPAIVGESA